MNSGRRAAVTLGAGILVTTAGVLTWASCSSPQAPHHATSPAAGEPCTRDTYAYCAPVRQQAAEGNPVDILRQAKVPVAAGTVYGSTDIYGDRYASGDYASGEDVTVYMYQTQEAAYEWIMAHPGDDEHAEILGHLFTMTVTGAYSVSAPGVIVFPVPAATLAARVHGTVIAGSR